MGKRKKEHNKKIAKRNERLKQDNNRLNKFRQEFFKKIMLEQQQGKFNDENLKDLPGVSEAG